MAACKKSKPVPSGGTTTGKSTDTGGGGDNNGSLTSGEVIIAGYIVPSAKGSAMTACYWRGNGNRVNLHTTSESEARALAVSGGVVYTAGYYKDGEVTKACYWKGTVKTDLHTGTESRAYGIAVDGTDVYVAGYYKNGTSSLDDRACYWKNGVKTDLNTVSSSIAFGIAVSGGQVYTSGTYMAKLQGTDFYMDPALCYWTGTTVTDVDKKMLMPSSLDISFPIAVSGANVYTAGTYNLANSSYWTGAVETALHSETNSSLHGLTVAGGDVYTAGAYFTGKNFQACYWKNTAKTDLPPIGNLKSESYAIAVSGSDVYVAGTYFAGADGYLPCYWKNGEQKTLPNNGVDHGIPYGIAVVP